ncbi:hypothetical protein CDD81_1994 [Ophiocordyceps australis]|uniref:Phospholipase n=1 Tax=Ophiocordyceps australis TaxID=1399860 RepID=A0A2C5XB42_9HYPO|nr:hypothetical protein CDD81_1994 [Ophiocordyceps australis]
MDRQQGSMPAQTSVPRHGGPQPASTPPATAPNEASNDDSQAADEAPDYWNNGFRHANLSPLPVVDEAPRGECLDESINGASSSSSHHSLPSPLAARRSVQFARPDALEESIPPQHSRNASWDAPETPKSRSASFMSKIKALAITPTPNLQTPRSPSIFSQSLEAGSPSAAASPTVTRVGTRLPDTLHEEQSDDDADIEETADEATAAEQQNASTKKKKRKMRRFRKGHTSTPSTPSRFPGDMDPWGAYDRLLRRRASMPDTSTHQRVMSEGEGREQMRRRPFRRGHSFMDAVAMTPGDDADDAEGATVAARRARHLRRITVLGGGGMSDGDHMTPRRPFFNSERASNFGAQKWKRMKSTLKLLRQKKEDRFDYFKSAELMAELRAGAPAVLMLASMIQRDEHGNKRIPVLLEQLKLKIKDSSPIPDDDKERHWIFTIELEYGSGPSRMSWTVVRTLSDIYNLHFRYKFALNNDKYRPARIDLGTRPKQPKFPYSAFPYLRRARGKDDDSDDDEQASVRGEETAGEGTDDGQNHPRKKKSRGSLWGMRRRSTGQTDPGEGSNAEGGAPNAWQDMTTRRQRYVEKQRRILEKYLSEMIRWLIFRADSNRLCRFLELSALGVRLAAEGSYHGKEGYLHIQSAKGLDFRRVLTPAKVIARHSRKWFLVRQSYIVCVDSPENMNIYDVYLVDSKFSIVSKRNTLKQIASKEGQPEMDLTVEATPSKHHTLTLQTSERKVRLFSRFQSVMRQFEDSINGMLRQTLWYSNKRFESFAPVRTGVFAQWLVDGRDYMWNVSRAINMARDVIYIHDWWLSPELYMRRPACISQKWRLDRLLQKKAKEGVKIFVIIYRNVEAAIPIDSEYTKFSLLNLHPNIFVQRSPNQFKKNQFFFAHHEKICIVDHDVAFLGGIDLCFGRWDSPQHPIADDKPTGFEMTDRPKDTEHCQLFPGKDYSNPRVQDFFRLNEPYEEMYDRNKVPRMPWHDVSMQVVGQPARDLTRHFVQRWNYLRRGRKPTRPLPFLLPPPDAQLAELDALGLSGSCEVQMLRSAATWSLGLEETEQSIQNAYVKLIEESEHFVYIENQFFITSTEAYNTKIENHIGDALVERIIRAHQNGDIWRCAVVIPLMPGFQNTVDEQEGTSVRLILMCQYRSICRGDKSIFGRLRAVGIEPEDYIGFYSLRQWGTIGNGTLVTEQLYIHAKTIIVDDRVALIGSANINERSMLGSRDSECAALVRDADMITSTMAGKPYKVGRFAHTLRVRLMREHLGLDVDGILEQERQDEVNREAFEEEMNTIYHPGGDAAGPSSGKREQQKKQPWCPLSEIDQNVMADSTPEHEGDSSHEKGKGVAAGGHAARTKHQLDVSGHGPDKWRAASHVGVDSGRDSVVINGVEVLVHSIDGQGRAALDAPLPPHHLAHGSLDGRSGSPADGSERLPPMPALNRRTTEQLGMPRAAQLPPLPVVDDSDIGGPTVHIDPESGHATHGPFHPMAADILPADIDKDCMRDPVNPNFLDEIWNRAASNNTKLYRRVFRCMPDSEVSTWSEYREYVEYGERFRASMEGRARADEAPRPRDSTAAGAGVGAPGPEALMKSVGKTSKATDEKPKVTMPDGTETDLDEKAMMRDAEAGDGPPRTPCSRDASSTPDAIMACEKPSPSDSQKCSESSVADGGASKTSELTPSKYGDRRATFPALEKQASREVSAPPPGQIGSIKRRRRATTKGSRRGLSHEEMPSRANAEELLKMVQGAVVQFPYDWLHTEERNGNWGFQVDSVAPLAIYN